MKFGINSKEKLVTHWLLNDLETAKAVGEETRKLLDGAPLYGNSPVLEAKVTVNGVELPFEAFEKWLSKFVESNVNEALERFSDLDKEVERRMKKRIEEEVHLFLTSWIASAISWQRSIL
jgi:hypothetical protein